MLLFTSEMSNKNGAVLQTLGWLGNSQRKTSKKMNGRRIDSYKQRTKPWF